MLRSKPRKSGKIKLSWHRAAGQWTKYVGAYRTPEGVIRPKLYYLGSDQNDAVAKLVTIKARWAALKAAGKTLWEELEVGESHDAALPETSHSDAPRPPAAAPRKLASVTVRALADDYLGELRRRHEAGQVTKKHLDSQKSRLNCAVVPLAMLTLDQVDYERLQSAVFRLCQRPAYDTTCKHGTDESPSSWPCSHWTVCKKRS